MPSYSHAALYLRFIKTLIFMQKKRKIENSSTGLFQARKLRLLPAEQLGNILVFDRESKRKLLSLISADSLMGKEGSLMY